MHTATGLYAHITWHTRHRERSVRHADVAVIAEALMAAGQRTRVEVVAQAVLTDHVHAVLSYPPDATISAFVREAKSESARRVNCCRSAGVRLYWCRGFYAGSLARSQVRAARHYVASQFEKHPDRIPV